MLTSHDVMLTKRVIRHKTKMNGTFFVCVCLQTHDIGRNLRPDSWFSCFQMHDVMLTELYCK